ncbi:MAG: twin-arginine translocase TatA/TatE family subunit [Proteobacteria bacterium]|nr:twin-arginine translocase TatA/TatE family subunit [Pseudomonadota bacterium]MDA1062785.1 twin-arginine translocase TatA/TatE family subunit [Pseudomonadota bacterium]
MLSGISWPQLLIVLVIVLAIFGTKKFGNIGADLGKAIRGFKGAMSDAKDVKDQIEKDPGTEEDANFDNTPVQETRKDS